MVGSPPPHRTCTGSVSVVVTSTLRLVHSLGQWAALVADGECAAAHQYSVGFVWVTECHSNGRAARRW